MRVGQLNPTNKITTLARRYLPDPIRKPLGSLCGKIRGNIVYPFLGLIFDLSGGRFKADGCVFHVPKDITNLESRAGFLLNSHEEDERKLVKEFLLPDDSVLELGACLGIVSCITNKKLSNPTHHVAVEANPFCLSALHRNRELNKCGFLIENCAVSNQAVVTFFLHPRYVVQGTAKLESGFPIRVPGRSLKELINRYGPFSVLIMDIEGSELEILSSSREILQNFRLIIIELHSWAIGDEGIAQCREILEKSGFKMREQSYITEAWFRV